MKKISSIIALSLVICIFSSNLDAKCSKFPPNSLLLPLQQDTHSGQNCNNEEDEASDLAGNHKKTTEQQCDEALDKKPRRTKSTESVPTFDFFKSLNIKHFTGEMYSEKEIERIFLELVNRKSILKPLQVFSFLSISKYEKNQILRFLSISDVYYYLWDCFKLPYDYMYKAVNEKKLTIDKIKAIKNLYVVDRDLFKCFLRSKNSSFEGLMEILSQTSSFEERKNRAIVYKKLCGCGLSDKIIQRLISLNLSYDQIEKLVQKGFEENDIKLILDRNIIDFNLVLDTKISNKNVIAYLSSENLIDGLIKRIMENTGQNRACAERSLLSYNRFIFTEIPNDLFEKILKLEVNDFTYVIYTSKVTPVIIKCLNSFMDNQKLVYTVYFLEDAYRNLSRDLGSCSQLSLSLKDTLYSKIVEQMNPYDMMIRKNIIREIYSKEHIILNNKFFTKSVSSWREAPVNMSEEEIIAVIKEIAPESHFEEYLFEKSKHDSMSRYEGIGVDYQKLLQRILLKKDDIISNKECHDFILGQFYNQDADACKNRLVNIICLCAKTLDTYQSRSNFILSTLTNYRLDMVEKIFSTQYPGYENFFKAFNDDSFGAENMIAYRQALEMPLAIPLDPLSQATEDSVSDISLDPNFIVMSLTANFSKRSLLEYFRQSLEDNELIKQSLSTLKMSIKDYIRITTKEQPIEKSLEELKVMIDVAKKLNDEDFSVTESEHKKNCNKIQKLEDLIAVDRKGQYTCKFNFKKICKLIAFLNVFLSDRLNDCCSVNKFFGDMQNVKPLLDILEKKDFDEKSFSYRKEDFSELLIGSKEVNITFFSEDVEQQIIDNLFVKDKNIAKEVFTKCFFDNLIEDGYISQS